VAGPSIDAVLWATALLSTGTAGGCKPFALLFSLAVLLELLAR